MRIILVVLGLLALPAGFAAHAAQPQADVLPPGTQIPDAARPGPNFDVDRATDAYLALLSSDQRAQSDAYFEGGYWINLWGTLYTVGACALILLAGWSVRMREWAARRSRFRFLQTMLYAAAFVALLYALSLPWTWYSGFYREHQYGLSNLTLVGWSIEELKGLVINLIIFSIALAVVYEFIRRTGALWWAWATGIYFVFQLMIGFAYPLLIAPIFNDFKPLPQGEVRDAILSLARANQIPTDNVVWFDASKQTTRVSANVSGLFNTTQVSLNDNLLKKTSLPEIKAVMGHEMGHYVLDHIWSGTIYLSLATGLGFLLLHWLYGAYAGLRTRRGIGGLGDTAGLPLAAAILASYFFLATPLFNRIVYVNEAQADQFGINAAREPYGWATSAMRLASYRKLDPGPVEEFLFYDHPSGRRRVRMAMLWLKENQQLMAPAAAPAAAAK
jgi:STE24 endopeptidase